MQNGQKQIVTCIIPFYNEGKRVLNVLEAITKIKEIAKIICVDDGSTDQASKLIEEKFPQVELIRLDKNSGKSAAVYAGLSPVKTKYVFLIDADLGKIRLYRIKAALQAIEKDKLVDMLVFKHYSSIPWFDLLAKFFRGDVLISGERILKTTDLAAIREKEKPVGFQLEMAIDRYMSENNKNCFWLDNIGMAIHKSAKVGFWKGWRNDFLSHKEFLNKGLLDWSHLVLTFCKKKYKSVF